MHLEPFQGCFVLVAVTDKNLIAFWHRNNSPLILRTKVKLLLQLVEQSIPHFTLGLKYNPMAGYGSQVCIANVLVVIWQHRWLKLSAI